MPEKIVSAYQSVLDRHFDEDTALNKCKTTVGLLERIDKDINDASINGKDFSCSLVIQSCNLLLKKV
jgi:regulator of Ty1 transposition protein 103